MCRNNNNDDAWKSGPLLLTDARPCLVSVVVVQRDSLGIEQYGRIESLGLVKWSVTVVEMIDYTGQRTSAIKRNVTS